MLPSPATASTRQITSREPGPTREILPEQRQPRQCRIVRDSVSIPRQIRGILPRAPLAWSYLFSGTITELRCDAYSKAEADGRYLSSTGYTGSLDGRYLVTNANAAPLGWSHILSGTVTELTCDAWSKTEADGRYATAAAISAVDSRVTALENSGAVPADIHRQHRREHPEFHRLGQHHGSGCALHSRCADAPAEAHQRGGRSPAHRSRACEH